MLLPCCAPVLMTSLPVKGEGGGDAGEPPIIRFRDPPLNIALISSQANTIT